MKSSRVSPAAKSKAPRKKIARKSPARSARTPASATRKGGTKTKATGKKQPARTRTPVRARRASKPGKPVTQAKAKTPIKSTSRRDAGVVKRGKLSSRKTPARITDPYAPANRAGRKAPPQARPSVRPPVTDVVQEPAGVLPATPVAKPTDPLLVEAHTRLQQQAARAPMLPRVPLAPRPMPPRSGKPLWRRPHSS